MLWVGGYMLFHWWVGVPGEIRKGRLSFRSHVTPERRKMVPPFDFFVRVCVAEKPVATANPLISGAGQEDTRLNPTRKRKERERKRERKNPSRLASYWTKGVHVFPFRNYEFLSILACVLACVCIPARYWEVEGGDVKGGGKGEEEEEKRDASLCWV